MSPLQSRIHSIHDHSAALLQAGQIPQGLALFRDQLQNVRQNSEPDAWPAVCRHVFDNHLLRPLLHESPFSRRAFDKPRGYAGDAVLMDFIYGLQPLPVETTAAGRLIYDWETETLSCRAVRQRRDFCRQYLETHTEATTNAQVLSLACGHLREASTLASTGWRSITRYIACDQDEESLATVRRAYPNSPVCPIHASVRDLIAGRTSFEDLDLIYSAGLYDYLPQAVARRLTATLFKFLKPGGRLLLINFAPQLLDIAFMETAMDWHLIYRTPEQMADLPHGIEPGQLASARVFPLADGDLIAWEAKRAG